MNIILLFIGFGMFGFSFGYFIGFITDKIKGKFGRY